MMDGKILSNIKNPDNQKSYRDSRDKLLNYKSINKRLRQ